MTRFSLLSPLGLLMVLPSCAPGDGHGPIRYESGDKRSVFVVEGNRSYLGSADYPKNRNVTEAFGIKTGNFSDGKGNNCSSYNGITFSKSATAQFVCNGTEFIRREITDAARGRVFRYSSICWSFANGACKYVKSGPPARVVDYDVLPDGRLVSIYIAGYPNRDGSNTLNLVSKAAL